MTESVSTGTSDAVRVCARIRPLNSEESEGGAAVTAADSTHVTVVTDTASRKQQTFHCNAAVDGAVDQEAFFVHSGVVALLHKAIQGLHTTVFAYGQTGSGKTFTVFGAHDDPCLAPPIRATDGLLPRAASHLFQALDVLDDGREYAVSLSFLEVYNEQVFDLLAPSRAEARTPVPLRWEPAQKRFMAVGSTNVLCPTLSSLLRGIAKGVRARSVASHNLNARSSRGHCVVTLHVESVPSAGTVLTGGEELTFFGKITFCDLAGSERLAVTGSSGETRKETGQINKSLFTLGKVVASLNTRARLADPAVRKKLQRARRKKARASGLRGARGKLRLPPPPPLPYRDSKLTMLLCDSLGGSSMSLMIACVTPSFPAANESFRTLQFAMGVKRIRNRPGVVLDSTQRLVAELKHEVRALRKENMALRSSASTPLLMHGGGGGGGGGTAALADVHGRRPLSSFGFKPPSPVVTTRLTSTSAGSAAATAVRVPVPGSSGVGAGAGAGAGDRVPSAASRSRGQQQAGRPRSVASSDAPRPPSTSGGSDPFPGPPAGRPLSPVSESGSDTGYSDDEFADSDQYSDDDDFAGSSGGEGSGGVGAGAGASAGAPAGTPFPVIVTASPPRVPHSPVAGANPGSNDAAWAGRVPLNARPRSSTASPQLPSVPRTATSTRSSPSAADRRVTGRSSGRPPVKVGWATRAPAIELLPESPAAPAPPPAAPPAMVMVDTPEALEALLKSGGTLGPPPSLPMAGSHGDGAAAPPGRYGHGPGNGAARRASADAAPPAVPSNSALSKDVFLDPKKRAKALRRLKKKTRSQPDRRAKSLGTFDAVNDLRSAGRDLMRSTQHFAY